jgi:hypothetical protein
MEGSSELTDLEKRYLLLADRLEMYKKIYNSSENTTKLGREFHNQRNLVKREFKKVEKNLRKKITSNTVKRNRNNGRREKSRKVYSNSNISRYLANQSRRNNAARKAHEKALRFLETMNNNNENNA